MRFYVLDNVSLLKYFQSQMDGYHETSLTNKNGSHQPDPGDMGLGGCAGSKEYEQEIFNDPASCPR